MNTKQLRLVVAGLCILVVAPVFHYIILDGTSVVSLRPASPLAGIISQSLVTAGASTTLPQEGKDYSIGHVEYFTNKQWAVVFIKPLNTTLNATVLVLQQQNNAYQAVLGPGSAFPASATTGLPTGVTQYLKSRGVVYEPAVY